MLTIGQLIVNRMDVTSDRVSTALAADNSPGRRLAQVAAATMIGSAIEAFDFLAYGTAAALVFNKLYFPTADPATGTLAAFGAFASGLFARPIGGVIFGHFGDRVGRKAVLTFSLVLMGLATVFIGLLPTYDRPAFGRRSCW
jgi:MFS transporter, MHS family, shikimate and dehydroshikimate transport protein